MRVAPCEKSHIVALLGSVISSVVLIITVYCVWYPYLETSAYVPAQCLPYGYEDFGPVMCSSQSSTPCTTLPDASSVTGSFNFTEWPITYIPSKSIPTTTTVMSSSSTVPASQPTTTNTIISSTSPTTTMTPTPVAVVPSSSTAATTTSASLSSTPSSSATPATFGSTVLPGRRRKRAIMQTLPAELSSIPTPTAPYCNSFPCIMMIVVFKTTVDQTSQSVLGQLYSDYNQMTSYKTCSYSSCGSDNAENFNAVYKWFNSTKNQFQCYVNLYVSPHPVLMEVNFSYAAAANSIFWPIVSLIAFGTCFTVLRCFAWHSFNLMRQRGRSDSVPPEPSYAVNYSGSQTSCEIPLPPAYSTGTGANTIGLEFPDLSEKNSDIVFGDATRDANGPAHPAQWVVMSPPQYPGETVADVDVGKHGSFAAIGTGDGATGKAWNSSEMSFRY